MGFDRFELLCLSSTELFTVAESFFWHRYQSHREHRLLREDRNIDYAVDTRLMLHCAESCCVTDLVISAVHPQLFFSIWALLFSPEKYQFHMCTIFTNSNKPKLISAIFSLCEHNLQLHLSSSHHFHSPSQVYPLQVSASPRYSGFSAVEVTNPFTCLGIPSSCSSCPGPSTAAAPATALALATRSR